MYLFELPGNYKHSSGKGFSLIELMMVVAIIAILALVLIPKMHTVKNNAEEAGQETAVRVAQAIVARYNDIYPAVAGANHNVGVRWKSTHDNNQYSCLATRTELMLQQVNNSDDGREADQTKSSGMQNPYSHSTVVLYSSNISGLSASPYHCNPAFLITGSDALRYSSINSSTAGFKQVWGTVIIYIRNDTSDVEIFYITEDGNKSQLTVVN